MDQAFFWTATDLDKTLWSYERYFNLNFITSVTLSHNGVFLDNLGIYQYLPFPEFICSAICCRGCFCGERFENLPPPFILCLL
ncbi:MAG: hypothetical protein P8X98_17835, partial [Woeseiaceae bacterium]